MRVAKTLLLLALARHALALALNTPFQVIQAASVIDPRDGKRSLALQSINEKMMLDRGIRTRSLVVILPQLGEFDSCEFCEQLVAVLGDLELAEMQLRVIGIGDAEAARRFAAFTGLPLSNLRVDPDGALHAALGLHAGPCWELPEWVPDAVLGFFLRSLPGRVPEEKPALRDIANAWLNYLAMCAGICAPGTLAEIFRGYVGDRSAPERLRPDDIVQAGPITIGPGVGPVKIGSFAYENFWKNESGYQRPVELATVRLRNMVEVLSHWEDYVSNPTQIARRGATFIFEPTGETAYEYRHRGVLTYSESMSRPLTFLAPYIGVHRALNPLGLGDTGGKSCD
eukprot:scaffold188060_cov31-Tisochrysis_lutea.AAC.1